MLISCFEGQGEHQRSENVRTAYRLDSTAAE